MDNRSGKARARSFATRKISRASPAFNSSSSSVARLERPQALMLMRSRASSMVALPVSIRNTRRIVLTEKRGWMRARIASSSRKGRKGVSKAAFASRFPSTSCSHSDLSNAIPRRCPFGLDGLDESSVVIPNPQGDTRLLQRQIGRIEIGGAKKAAALRQRGCPPQNGMMEQLSDVAEFAFQLQFAFAVQLHRSDRAWSCLGAMKRLSPGCLAIHIARGSGTKRNGPRRKKNPRRRSGD